jgi:hypothetical protein
MYKQPISSTLFINITSILLDVVAITCINKKSHKLTQMQIKWFVDFVDIRVRWLYTNNKKWKQKLNNQSSIDYVYTFVNHWLDAFIKNPKWFQERHKNYGTTTITT